jgi:hypothetical protein
VRAVYRLLESPCNSLVAPASPYPTHRDPDVRFEVQSGHGYSRPGTVPFSLRPRSIGYEKVADAGQWHRRCTIRALERSYSLSGRPVIGRRASGNARSASPAIGTVSLCGFSLHSVGWIACPRAWGCPLISAGEPPPGLTIDLTVIVTSAILIGIAFWIGVL